MALFMKFGDIKGSATEEHHKEWISINSFQFGVGRGISSPTGASADREASLPSVSEIVVTKEQDASSGPLFNQALGLADSVDVTIDFISTGKEDTPYLQYLLTDVLISGFSQSSGGDRPSESLSLNFTKIEMKIAGSDPGNDQAPGASFVWNLATQAK